MQTAPANAALVPPHQAEYKIGIKLKTTQRISSAASTVSRTAALRTLREELIKAFNLDGIDDHITAGTTVGNFGTSDFTVEMWVKTTSARQESIVSKRTCGVGNGISLLDIRHFPNGTVLAEFSGSDTIFNSLTSTTSITNGAFHHIAVRRAGSNFELYIDGTLEASSAAAGGVDLTNGATFDIGALGCNGVDATMPFTGVIDEVSLYNAAVPAAGILGIYNAGSAGKCLTGPSHTLMVVSTAGGSITTPSGGSVDVEEGATTPIVAAADGGYSFTGWTIESGTGTMITNTASLSTTATMGTTDATVQANFVIDTYTITASAGSNGSITPSGMATINSGADQAYTITADSGFHIADVLVDGVSNAGAISSGSYTFTNVTANHTIAASFALDVCTTPPTGMAAWYKGEGNA